ncbi:ABC transporter permease [Geothrix sp. 21YS21S-2]|uniref:ABC transporter permease n=1 Tax=Geothrix sp. 21YS21S-2 TaxID=3068893 RepID=UPI0027B9981F|nr:ABC transporter permease [Geothrix sp. 21YS21S-2]
MDFIRNSALVHALGKENMLFAFRAIITQKLRSFLTLLGIVAGVATVIAMVSFVAGFNEAITGAFSTFGTTLVQFQKFEPRFGGPPELIPEEQRRRRNLTLDDAAALKRLATLAAAVSPERYLGAATATTSVKNREGAEANGPTIAGVVPDYLLANNSTLEDGRFFSETDVSHASHTCVIGYDVVKALFPGRDPVGREVLLQGVPLHVIGVLEKKGSQMGGSADNFLLIPLSVFDEMFPEVKNGNGDTLHIATVPKDPAFVHDMTDQEVAILRQHRGLRAHQANDFAIFTSEETLQTFQQVTGSIAIAMIFIAGIALLVGGVGIMNIMLVSVTERTREIGVRKAMGATRKDIAAQFLVEAVTLTCCGGALGIATGFAVAFLVRFTFDFPAAAPLWSVVLGFGISTAIGLGFGMWPALKAAKQDPIEALRYE